MPFSDELIQKTKEYFLRKYEKELSDSEATLYLTRLGEFGLLTTEILSNRANSS